MRAVTGELAPGDVSGRRARRTTAVADDEHGLVRVGRDGTGNASGQAAAEPGPATRAEDDEARLVMSRPLCDEPASGRVRKRPSAGLEPADGRSGCG